ncbi:hypothetical protein INT43_004955 [Umbelopsis isabellina]|uniref:KilA-N domain-containing protein n=1 Tax=Mortierella isabellina TaxID=91625 RepID=A0A8H7PEF7_MORIS|nr:hypothetical protein INT43_004955 [Umbelopsis isabellina]
MPAITFQSVDNEYEWGTYFDLKVLIMSRNGYINATKMCQDHNKRLDHWLHNSWSKDYINSFGGVPGKSGTPCIVVINSGSNDNRGTYVHLDIITYIAAWISVETARKVSSIANEYRDRKQKRIIHEKDDKISNLETKIDSLLEDSKRSSEKTSELLDRLSKLSLDNEITHGKLDKVQGTLEDRVVKPCNKGMISTVLIYEYDINKFRIFRLQKRSVKAVIKRYLFENPNAVKFAEIEYNPNSINYFIRFKERLGSNIKWYYNTFQLLDITKEKLKECIEEINNEKYEIENLL